jgi:phosphoglycerate kinase
VKRDILEESKKLINMRQLRSIEEIQTGINIILRMDTDLPFEGETVLDNGRLRKSIPTIRYLLDKNCKIVIVGHRGRPDGKIVLGLSLKPVYVELMGLLESDGQNTIESVFIDDIKDEEKISSALLKNQIIFVENLRFWNEEDEGDTNLFKIINKYVFVLVNDAFAVAHRKNASIILHRQMESYYGFDFIEEVEKINQILESEQKPMAIILGGAKEDKLKYLIELSQKADYILIGGKLPKLISNDQFLMSNEKIKIAELREDGLDLSEKDISKFSEIIISSNIVIWAGAMGLYEKENSREGTQKIALAVAQSPGYKVIAGGDTSASVKDLGLKDKIDFICSGGGVMLEMLVKGDLPAWT